MIKKIAWETFKNTGDINAFIELKQIEDIEKGIEGCASSEEQSDLQITNTEACSLESLKQGLGDTPFVQKNILEDDKGNNKMK